MKFAVKDVRPNPFRHIDRYPIRPEKVAALRESLRATGYWGNVVARAVDGVAEIAYGHHRLAAIKEEYGADEEIDLLIRDLDDDAMLKIMARENMEEWGSCAAIEQETVRAVIEAYAGGRIQLAPVPKDTPPTNIRYAPSFSLNKDVRQLTAARPYTTESVAVFVGWSSHRKVRDTLSALEFIEEGLLTEKDFDGLSTTQAAAVVAGARRVREQREAAARKQQEEAKRATEEADAFLKRQQKAQADREAREAEAAAARRRQEEARRAQEEADRKARDQQRAEDERRRAKQEAEAAKKRKERAEAAEREAREKAQQAEQERRIAEENRQQAEKRQATAIDAAKREREEGRRAASLLGRAASEQIKAGKLTAQGVRDLAVEYVPLTAKVLPDIEKFTSRLSRWIDGLLHADSWAIKLDEVVKHREHLSEEVRKNAALKLRELSKRALAYAEGLWPTNQDAPPKKGQPRLLGREVK
jgi:hypothetical protein